MARKVNERIPKDLFIKLMIEKANVINDHLKKEYGSVNHSCQYWSNYGSYQNL